MRLRLRNYVSCLSSFPLGSRGVAYSLLSLASQTKIICRYELANSQFVGDFSLTVVVSRLQGKSLLLVCDYSLDSSRSKC